MSEFNGRAIINEVSRNAAAAAAAESARALRAELAAELDEVRRLVGESRAGLDRVAGLETGINELFEMFKTFGDADASSTEPLPPMEIGPTEDLQARDLIQKLTARIDALEALPAKESAGNGGGGILREGAADTGGLRREFADAINGVRDDLGNLATEVQQLAKRVYAPALGPAAAGVQARGADIDLE